MVKTQGTKEITRSIILTPTSEPTGGTEGEMYYDSTSGLKVRGSSSFAVIGGGELGEVKMFALSMTGAITKAALQGKGWAICDGTTPAAQGISSPTIETTPNLQEKFLRMSNDETSGGTGGADTHTHVVPRAGYGYNGSKTHGVLLTSNNGTISDSGTSISSATPDSGSSSSLPAYYEVAYFMKVK